MSLDINRLRRADRIAGAGAVAFLIFLFLFKWYGGSASSSIGGLGFSSNINGWHAFQNSRWIWLITIIVALGAVALTAAQRELQSPVKPSVIVAGLGALSMLLILYRIVHHPSGGVSGTIAGVHYSSSYGIKIGIWLGLIAAAAIAYGGYLAMQEEGTSLADVRHSASTAFSGLPAMPDAASGASAGAPAGAGAPMSTAAAAPIGTPAAAPIDTASPGSLPLPPPATPGSIQPWEGPPAPA
jgi:hypothetical protein